MKTNTPRFLLLVSFSFHLFVLNAQLNLQVGYGLGFVGMNETMRTLEAYRIQNPWLTTDFKSISSMNNLSVGFKQSWQGVALGLNWKYRFADTKGSGIEPIGNTSYTRQIYFTLESYSFFLETGNEALGLGTSLNLNTLYIKEKHTGSNDKFSISRENQWGSEFYLNINFPASASCQVTLRPFYFMPWSDFNLSSLQSDLHLVPDLQPRKESLRHFGVSLILSNGPQSD